MYKSKIDQKTEKHSVARQVKNHNSHLEQEADIMGVRLVGRSHAESATGLSSMHGNKSTNKTGLPELLKERVEKMSGLSMEGVKVHYNSEKPGKLGAFAYTQGKNIHVAPGQEKHLPHEAWHVVQQMNGNVEAEGMPEDAYGASNETEAAPVQFKKPGLLNLSGMFESKKQHKVAEFPTKGSDNVIVKPDTNPEIEEALADFYNVAGRVRHKKMGFFERMKAWKISAPETRGLTNNEKGGIGRFFRYKNQATPGAAPLPFGMEDDQTVGDLINKTTVFSKAKGTQAGYKIKINDQRSDDELPDYSAAGYDERTDTPEYRQAIGYTSALDMIAGNPDRTTKMIGPQNFIEDRKNRKLQLIDNDYERDRAALRMLDKGVWGDETRRHLAGGVSGFVRGRMEAQKPVSDDNGMVFPAGAPDYDPDSGEAPLYSKQGRLFGSESTANGLNEAFDDLPAIQAALLKKFMKKGQKRLQNVADERNGGAKRGLFSFGRKKSSHTDVLGEEQMLNPYQKELIRRIGAMQQIVAQSRGGTH